MKCEHEDGWVISEIFAVSIDSDESFDLECTCNKIGCKEKRIIHFDVSNVRANL